MKKAVWGMEYDGRTDSIYYCPKCPDCDMPIFDHEQHICHGCGEQLELTEDMIHYEQERIGTKEDIEECMQCHEMKMKTVKVKNPVTKEWQYAYGQCECGCRFIV